MSILRSPHRLRCEYRVNPMGIHTARPRLSWEMRDDRRGARQTAYRIETETEGSKGWSPLWDSGKVMSDASCHVPYGGPELTSRQNVRWRVRLWDAGRKASSWSAWSRWEMGLLSRRDWWARWIGGSLAGDRWTSVPAPFLRRDFVVGNKPVRRARLYVTALGLYEFHLNGERVGDDVFTPGWTEYGARVQYQVYDVTKLLQPGDNAMGAILGDGWYCGHVEWRGRQRYGDRPKLLAQLAIDFCDGSTMTVITDEGWQVAYGPIVASDLLMGESYNAQLEFPGWSEPRYGPASWQAVNVFQDTGIDLSPTLGPLVRQHEELSPVADPAERSDHWRGRWLFDLGQNMVGRIRMKVKGPAGTTVTIRFAEILDADGKIYTENLRTAKATDYYTLKGDGEEIYESRFTFHGFRYVELADYPGTPTRDTITGIVLYSDTPPTGSFQCSNRLLNQLQHNIRWGQKGNFLEVPTDCPQRDERLGWTGDAQVFIRTAAFNCDVDPFFTKWQRDIADAQHEDGGVPCVVPSTSVTSGDGGPAWSDAAVICPWTLYVAYGDRGLLEAHYDSMRRYVDQLHAKSLHHIRCHPDVDSWGGFGDWLSINAVTPKDLIGTAYLAYSTELMGKIAAVLGKKADAKEYKQRLADVKDAFQKRFVTDDGIVLGQTQTGYVLAVHFDLLPKRFRKKAVKALVADIESRDMHLSSGFVGSSYLPFALSENGRADVAYSLLHQKTWPSWLYAVTQGATSIWERWDGWTHDKGFQSAGMNSFNHYAYGAIGSWLYQVAGGLELDPARPGYKHILIRPNPGGGLTRARARLHTMYGPAESGWRIADGALHMKIVVPANASASVHVPVADPKQVKEGATSARRARGVTFVHANKECCTYEIGAGDYEFSAPWPPSTIHH